MRSQEQDTPKGIAARIEEHRSRSPFEAVDDAIRFSAENGISARLPRTASLEVEAARRCDGYALAVSVAEYFGEDRQGRPWSITMQGEQRD